MLMSPPSPDGATSGTVKTGCGASLPFWKTRTRPGRSVKNMRPSGSHAIDHGTSRLATTVSTRKLAAAACAWFAGGLFCDVASTSPAPRPGGGWLQPISATKNVRRKRLRGEQGKWKHIFVWSYPGVRLCFRGRFFSYYHRPTTKEHETYEITLKETYEITLTEGTTEDAQNALSPLPLVPIPQLMLYVLVQQLDLVALLAQLDAHQVTHRQHSYPALPVYHRQVTSANHLHAFKRLMRSFVAVDHSAEFARNFANSNGRRIAPLHHHATQNVTLRKNAEQFAALVDHANGAHVALGHELGCILDGRRSFH